MAKLDPASIRLNRLGSGPPIVLLHGIGTTRRMWDGLAPLADAFTLLSYDLPIGDLPACNLPIGDLPAGGLPIGDLPIGMPYEIDDLSDQLAGVMTLAGIQRAHLLGCSLGGMVAQHFAATRPERVDRLVLCDTTPALSDGMRDEYLPRGPAHAAMARADLMDLAEEIAAPTLVLCADGAELAMREGADFLARSIPYGRFAFVPRAAADSVTERPDWITRVLRDFLR